MNASATTAIVTESPTYNAVLKLSASSVQPNNIALNEEININNNNNNIIIKKQKSQENNKDNSENLNKKKNLNENYLYPSVLNNLNTSSFSSENYNTDPCSSPILSARPMSHIPQQMKESEQIYKQKQEEIQKQTLEHPQQLHSFSNQNIEAHFTLPNQQQPSTSDINSFVLYSPANSSSSTLASPNANNDLSSAVRSSATLRSPISLKNRDICQKAESSINLLNQKQSGLFSKEQLICQRARSDSMYSSNRSNPYFNVSNSSRPLSAISSAIWSNDTYSSSTSRVPSIIDSRRSSVYSTGRASFSGSDNHLYDNSHLRPHLANSKSLLSRSETLDQYKDNAIKSNDPKQMFEIAQLMLATAFNISNKSNFNSLADSQHELSKSFSQMSFPTESTSIMQHSCVDSTFDSDIPSQTPTLPNFSAIADIYVSPSPGLTSSNSSIDAPINGNGSVSSLESLKSVKSVNNLNSNNKKLGINNKNKNKDQINHENNNSSLINLSRPSDVPLSETSLSLSTFSTVSETSVFSKSSHSSSPPFDSQFSSQLSVPNLELINNAFKLIKRSAERGHTDSLYTLGDMYFNGIGCQKNFREAFNKFLAASKQGNTEATYRVALCLEKGWGTRKDSHRSMLFLRKACSHNHAGAMLRYGYACFYKKMGMTGKGVQREGIQWLERAAEVANATFPSAPFELARIYEKGFKEIVLPDPPYAAKLYAISAELNYGPACVVLGRAYETGRSALKCAPDAALSIHFYTLGALNNEPDAMMGLCAWYLIGAENILIKNESEAHQWALKAAMCGHIKAQSTIGYFYENGIGTKSDLNESIRWYEEAARHGDERSKAKLLKLRGNSVDNNNKQDKECIIM